MFEISRRPSSDRPVTAVITTSPEIAVPVAMQIIREYERLQSIHLGHAPSAKSPPPRQGKHPRTGEPMTIPAKPKRTVVKALALKGLKEMVK